MTTTPILRRGIGGVDLEFVPGQPLVVAVTELGALPGPWTAEATTAAGVVVATVIDHPDVADALVVTWPTTTKRMAARSWRLRQAGVDRLGGTLRTAAPGSEPGAQTVPVTLDDAQTIEVEVAAAIEGPRGPAGQILDVTVETLAPGSEATVDVGGTPEQRTLTFGVPVGLTGPSGTITAATAEAVDADEDPAVDLGGTASARTFHFHIPAGQRGPQGIQGIPGVAGSHALATASVSGDLSTVEVVPSNTTNSERTIWSVAIAPGTVAAGDILAFNISGEIRVTGTGSATAVFALKLNNTIVAQSATTGPLSFTASTNPRRFRCDTRMVIGAGALAQAAASSLDIPAVGNTTWQISSAGTSLVGVGVAAENLADAAADTLSLTVTWTTASTNTANAAPRTGELVHIQKVPGIALTLEPSSDQMDAAVAAAVLAAGGHAAVVEVRHAERLVSVTATATTVDVPGLTATIPGGLGRPVRIEWGGTVQNSVNLGRSDLNLVKSIDGAPYTSLREGVHTCHARHDPDTLAWTPCPDTVTYTHRIAAEDLEAGPIDLKVQLRAAPSGFASGTATLAATTLRAATLDAFKL